MPVRIGSSPVMKLARPAVQLALRVVVGEPHSVLGHLVEIGRCVVHHSLVVGADIFPADIVAHDHQNVGLRVLSPCGACCRETDDCADYERDREISTLPTKHLYALLVQTFFTQLEADTELEG
ncbi:MAG: hypothetical protein WBQ86_16345 [Candidatus Binatus sp.]